MVLVELAIVAAALVGLLFFDPPGEAAAIALERLGGLLLGVGAVTVPFLGARWITRRTARRHPRLRAATGGASYALAILGCLVLLAYTMCGYPGPPGTGVRARIGFRHGAPVIAALERFRKERGRLPETLPELTSERLDPRHLEAFPELLGYPLEYERADRAGAYLLRFRYQGPGMNECDYSRVRRSWECSGYF